MAVAGAGAGAEKLWPKSEPEPKLWPKSEPEPKINNFGSATLYSIYKFLFSLISPILWSHVKNQPTLLVTSRYCNSPLYWSHLVKNQPTLLVTSRYSNSDSGTKVTLHFLCISLCTLVHTGTLIEKFIWLIYFENLCIFITSVNFSLIPVL